MQDYNFKPIQEIIFNLKNQLRSTIDNIAINMGEYIPGYSLSFNSYDKMYSYEITKYKSKSIIGKFFYRIFFDRKIENKIELYNTSLVLQEICKLEKAFEEASQLLKSLFSIEQNLEAKFNKKIYIDIYKWESSIENFKIIKCSFNSNFEKSLFNVKRYGNKIKYRLSSSDKIKYKVSDKLKEAHIIFEQFHKDFNSYTKDKIDSMHIFIQRLKDTNYNFDKHHPKISLDDDSPRKKLVSSLRLSDIATDNDIKKSYKKFIFTSHPDKLVNESKDVQEARMENFKYITGLMEVCGLKK